MRFWAGVLTSLSLQYSALAEVEFDEGKCHIDFVECESVCEFSCLLQGEVSQIGNLVGHTAVLNVLDSHKPSRSEIEYVDRSHKVQLMEALHEAHASEKKEFVVPSEYHLVRQAYNEYSLIPVVHSAAPLPTWSCSDHCKYECMHKVSDERKDTGQEPIKFFGKWPFRRVFICQEFVSSIFSIINGIPYVVLLTTSVYWSARIEHKLLGGVMAFAWVASCMFHCRDVTATMYADYFLAFAGLLSNLALALIRTVNLNRTIVLTLLFAVWTTHVSYLSLVHFDFDLNMQVAIVIALISGLLWLKWYIKNRKTIPHAWMIIMVNWGVSPLLALFELNDFPPGSMGLADAHAFWHISTIPMSTLCALFLYRDTLYLQRGASKENWKGD